MLAIIIDANVIALYEAMRHCYACFQGLPFTAMLIKAR